LVILNSIKIYCESHVFTYYLLVTVTALCIAIIAMALAYLLLKFLDDAIYLARSKLNKRIKALQSRPPRRLRKILGLESKNEFDFRKYINKLKWLIPEHLIGNAFFTAFSILTSIVVFSLCVSYLKNPGAGIVSVLTVVLTATQVFTHGKVKRQVEINNQLPAVTRIFGSVLDDTGNFRLAMDAVAERSPEPSRGLFTKITQMLDHGVEPKAAFKEVIKATGAGYSIMFVNLLTDSYFHGTTVLPRFARLAGQIDTMQELQRENSPDVITTRISAIILHIGVIVLAFLTTILVPDAKKYLIDAPVGKTLVTLCFLSVVVAIIADRLWGDIKE